ncbi:MAG TPA: hypothetical protein VKV15_25870 [Bryobacteraceae bacterium]|jgi:hypothetical protein|nr:hypothetical protein [Bryobacteraceae bacterium]
MRLPFTSGLIPTTHFDDEMRRLADRHYSRRTPGARQFAYSGRKLVLRNAEGTVLVVWMYPRPEMRMDGQTGYNCAIFHNESPRKASDILLEAETWAFAEWGPNRLYTYIDPSKTAPIKRHGEHIVGFCFRKAGWKPMVNKDGTPRLSSKGLWLFVKLPWPKVERLPRQYAALIPQENTP